jgi:glyoxylase-like metal-dependent hydrolase (beta-lactamase superfamily II)
MEKVAENLYVIIGNGGNVAVVPTSEGVILVDDKFAEDGPEILAHVKKLTEKPVRYVLNTHQHPDHTGGNDARMAANAEIIIHKNARANMLSNKMPGLPRITFADETEILLGGREVRAKHLGRGHTKGGAVIYFPAERVLHTGELFIINGSAPFIGSGMGGSLKELDRTLQKALEYDPNICRSRMCFGSWRAMSGGNDAAHATQKALVDGEAVEAAGSASGYQICLAAAVRAVRRVPRRRIVAAALPVMMADLGTTLAAAGPVPTSLVGARREKSPI